MCDNSVTLLLRVICNYIILYVSLQDAPVYAAVGSSAHMSWTIPAAATATTMYKILSPTDDVAMTAFGTTCYSRQGYERLNFTGDLTSGLVSFWISGAVTTDGGTYTISLNNSNTIVLGQQTLYVTGKSVIISLVLISSSHFVLLDFHTVV